MPAYSCKEAMSSPKFLLNGISLSRISCHVVVFVDPHSRGKLFHLANSVKVLAQVGLGVFVSREDMEGVAIDLAVASDGEVCGRDGNVVFVDVLVDAPVQELALDDARVLLSRLVDANSVVGEVEGDDESTVEVLGDACVEARRETEDLLVVVHRLKEVTLGLLGHQAVHLGLTVLLVTETVVGRLLNGHGLSGPRELNGADGHVDAESATVELLRELINASDLVNAAICADSSIGRDLVARQVVVADESLSWLVDVETVGELLASEEEGEGVTAVVRCVGLSDFKGVIGQVVVDNVGEVFTTGEETENLTIMVKELLLGSDLAATEGFLEEVSHLGVVLSGRLHLRSNEVVVGKRAASCQRSSLGLQKAFEGVKDGHHRCRFEKRGSATTATEADDFKLKAETAERGA